MRRMLLCLLMLAPGWAMAAPQLWVRSQLVGADNAVVGGVVMLQVDVLVDTWFAAPPEFARLELPDAIVSPPGGEAMHLTEEYQGIKVFGLRFNYQIIPQVARAYSLPALAVIVHPGQGTGPVSLTTTAQRFIAGQPAGAPPGEAVLVANNVAFSQTIEPSSPALQVGDTVTRRLAIQAGGAPAMLIPAPQFAEVSGLERSLQPATVHPLDDGRGGSGAGAREDSARYRGTRAGSFLLPAISLRWWSSEDRQMHTASVPAVPLRVTAASRFAAPFSIAEDLRQLRRNTQLHIGQHWLAWGAAAALVLSLIYCARSWPRRVWAIWLRWRDQRQQAWLASPAFAWRQARRQLAGRPARLDALYLWVRRRAGVLELLRFARGADSAAPVKGGLAQVYGHAGKKDAGVQALAGALGQLQGGAPAQRTMPARRYTLKPLNPRKFQEATGG